MCFSCAHSTSSVEVFLAALKARKYSPKSIANYRHGLRTFLYFLDSRDIPHLRDVTLRDLEAYRLALIERDLAGHTLELYLRAVRLLFRYLTEEHELFDNPAERLIIPQPKRRLLPVPNEDEVRRLLAQPDVSTPIGLRDRALMETAYSTGLRLAELQRLDVFDPDLPATGGSASAGKQSGTLRVLGKGNKERVVPLGRHAVLWLRRYIHDGRPKLLKGTIDLDALWIGLRANRLNRIPISKLVHRYGEQARLPVPVSPHALRRACATHMLARGAHPIQIQLLLGHTNLRSLSQYLRVSVRDMRRMHRTSKPGR